MISGWTNVELQGKTRNYTITGLKSWIAYDVQVKFIASGGSSSESNPRPVRVVSYGMIIVYVQMHLYFIFFSFSFMSFTSQVYLFDGRFNYPKTITQSDIE